MKAPTLLVITAMLLAVAACSRHVNESATTNDGAKVALKSQGDQSEMQITTKAGEKTSLRVSDTGMKPTTDLPPDLPVYPKARLRMDNSTPTLRMLGYVTADPVADTVKFYTQEMVKQGWTIGASMAMGEGQMITAKKENRSCNLTINKDGNDTYIQITLNTTKA